MRRCAFCGCVFRVDRYHPNQKCCGERACRRSRRGRWQREKLRVDADYRANQAAAQARWRESNPGYWRVYRATHPQCGERNRRGSAQRREGLKRADVGAGCVAKMDFASSQKAVAAGRYRLERVDGCGDAKMDVVIVELSVLEGLSGTG